MQKAIFPMYSIALACIVLILSLMPALVAQYLFWLLFQFDEEQQQAFSLQRGASIFLTETVTFNVLWASEARKMM